jgi:hypothetical protein
MIVGGEWDAAADESNGARGPFLRHLVLGAAVATLTVSLSAKLQQTLFGPGADGAEGIYAWLVNFDHATGDYQASYQLAGWDGSLTRQVVTPAINVDVAEPANGGKYYVVIQSTNGSPLTFGSGNDIATESDLNWDNASQYDFRYDSFEFSLLGQAGDAGNLTDVNGFGIPMSVEVSYGNGAPTLTRGYNVNGASIFSDIADINSGALVYTYGSGPLFGNHRMAASPAEALAKNGPGGASYTDWNAYVQSLGANEASGVAIAGYFNGAPSIEYTTYGGNSVQYKEYHNGGFYSYKLTWEQGTGTAGTYVFKPEANSQIKGEIRISTADLANSIYSTLGNAHVLNPDGTRYQFSSQVGGETVINSDMSTGANNQWGAFFVKLITGFVGGYLGSTHTPENSLLGSAAVSLSHNWNFDPTFAFGGHIAAGQAGAVTPWAWAGSYGTGVSYDPYAKIFFDNSNSYGNGYSDNLMSLFQQGGPLIPTGYSDTLTNPFSTTLGAGNITVSDPNAANYQVGDLVTFNVSGTVGGIAINNNTYSIYSIDTANSTYQFSSGVAATAATNNVGGAVIYQKNVENISLTLFDDNEAAAPGDTLGETQGYTPPVLWNNSAGPFVNPQSGNSGLNLILDFSGITNYRVDPSSTITIGFYTGQSGGQASFSEAALPSSGTETLYQTWVYSGGAFSAGGAPSASGAVLNINGLPYATGVNWYQIEVSNGGVSRTYNLYAKAQAGVGVENPYYSSGTQVGSIAVDNLASIPIATLPSTTQYVTSLTISAFNGGMLSMDPSLLSFNPTGMASWAQPLAPVLGTLSGSVFSNWGGSENLTNPNTNLADVTGGELAFGWQGSDMTWVGYNAANNVQVLQNYTNKVGGLNGAMITFGTGTFHNSINVSADIDGKWSMAAASQFSNGQYTAYVTEYDSAFATQLGRTSAALNFTVALDEMGFASSARDFIQLDGSGSASGNWVRLDTAGSTMPNSTLLVYVTDLDGNLVGRDGETGAGVTLDEAVVGRIGSVATDGGSVLFQGGQSVYLKVGQQLHFAVQTGNDVIQQLPNVQVTGGETLSVKVAGTFGTFDLTAHVDNTLSSSATLAGSQREYNEPWVFLNQGQQLHVEVAGSAQNINTIHFVHLDIDRAGNWSVGGVGYGNTDAFRAAVQANWDPGFVSSGGRGNFHDDGNWTVSKGSGFYAPVLVTEGGDIFVIGKANVDGRDHIRSFGENTFGFEDLRADQHSDFDYNDLVMKLSMV